MKTSKRTVTALLLLSMLLSASACSGSPTEEKPDPSAQPDPSAVNKTETVEAETEPDELADDLPETDLGGYNFRIACYLDTQIPTVYTDSLTGSPVNDAVFEKISAVEERFNCNVTLAESLASETEYSASILAGDDDFDVATGHDITIANMTLEGNFLNIYDLPYLDFSKPWWPAQTVNSLTVDGAMYMFSNDFSYNLMTYTNVWYFNKERFTDMDLDYPYEMVYEGTWTLDAMNDLLKDSYRDVNGNGKVDVKGDSFGVVNSTYYHFLSPFNMEPYRKTEDGGLEYYFDVDRYSTLVEKFANMLYGNSGIRIAAWQTAQDVFTSGRALMIYEGIAYATDTLSHSEVVYGVLPMPKFDETQSQYYGGCGDRPYVVPITVAGHLEQTGLIIEALSAEGRRKVYPAYFEAALKSRYADQTDDANMIDIIMNNNILSFSYMYGNFAGPYNVLLNDLFAGKTPNTDVASWAAKHESGQTKYVESLMTQFRAVREQQQEADGQ